MSKERKTGYVAPSASARTPRVVGNARTTHATKDPYDEDADDLAFINARIKAVKEGRSRIVSGQELQERLARLLA